MRLLGSALATRCVLVADSEADIYELFLEPRPEGGADWLIRACQDRAILQGGENDAARNLPVEQIITRAPIAVFEVLSPEDSINRMMAKLADYERMGIKSILILDPKGQHFRYVAGRLEPLSPEPFDLPGSSCRFDLSEIEKLLD